MLKSSEEEKLRQTKLIKDNKPIILNGRAALAAGKDDLSSSDDDEGSTRHKFSQPDHARIMIESMFIYKIKYDSEIVFVIAIHQF